MNQEPNLTKRSKVGVIIGIIVAVLVVVGIILAVAMNQETTAPASTQTTETGDTQATEDDVTPTEDTDETDAASTITFNDDGFSPSTITVKKGAVVTVTNESDTEVQFSSDNHPTHRENPEMNLRVLAPGESASFTATTVGTHGFHDHIDDSKTGTLVVTE